LTGAHYSGGLVQEVEEALNEGRHSTHQKLQLDCRMAYLPSI